MNKFKFLGAVIAVASMLPLAASAASITNVQFDNGQTTTSCTAGQSVNVTFRVSIPTGEVAELGQVDVLGDNLAPALPTSLGGDLGLQEGLNDVQMTVICPQNTANYTVQFSTAGIYGGQRAVTMTDGVTSTASFGNSLRVVANGSTTGGTTSSTLDQLTAAVAALAAQINAILHPVTPPAPTTSAVCTAYAQANTGTQYGVSNDANVRLQGFLLSQGASIPALKAGASFGFDGPQTEAARATFVNANHCI